MRTRIFLLCMILSAGTLQADLLVLQTGKTIAMTEYFVEGASIRVVLNERSEIVIPLEWLKEIRATPEEKREVASVARSFGLAYESLIFSVAKKHSLDWKLVASVIAAESNFNPRAVSLKGALGLMQLMPDTARLYNVTDPYDPHQNTEAGARHLKFLLGRYSGKLELALAAYNAGEKVVDRYRGIPPYNETRQYIKRVLNFYKSL